MNLSNLNFENLKAVRNGGIRKAGMVYLKSGRKDNLINLICISGDIAEEAKLENGDAVFVQAADKIFRIVKDSRGDFHVRKSGRRYIIANRDLAVQIKVRAGATEFTASVDNGKIYFMAKAGEQ